MNTELPQYDGLNIAAFQHSFDDMSESYKLFWFKAIFDKAIDPNENRNFYTFDEIICSMLADAWYMVSEYHLNLGPSDKIEEVLKYLCDNDKYKFKSSCKKDEMIETFSAIDDPVLKNAKKVLTYNVPYRFQVPITGMKNGDFKGSTRDVAAMINSSEGIIYKIKVEPYKALQNMIFINPTWKEYFKVNAGIINGWIQYNLIKYLQRRNPAVPGIPDKIVPPEERDLKEVRDYWKTFLTIEPMLDIYQSKKIILGDSFSIDHFVPWSYVAHDELWNLCPTAKEVNSSKNNSLPNWDKYFKELVNFEYAVYKETLSVDKLMGNFNKCIKKNVNSEKALTSLYVPNNSKEQFCNVLEELVKPSYFAAKNMGFTYGWEVVKEK